MVFKLLPHIYDPAAGLSNKNKSAYNRNMVWVYVVSASLGIGCMAMFAAFPSTILEAAMGAHGEPMVARMKDGIIFRANGPEVLRLPTKSSLPLVARRSRGSPAYPRKWCQEPLLGPHLHTHRGSG